MEEGTRRSWDADNQQTEAARSAYARSQMQMRQWNKELNEFAEMQQHFGKDTPYKTIGAFRRAYRSAEGSLSYGKSHFMRRDERQLKSFQAVLGEENAPKTLAEFQQMKYNSNTKVVHEFQLMAREVKLKRESIGQPKLPNYHHAIIVEDKTRNYVLNPESDKGKDKAHVINSVLGYGREDYKEFTAQIQANLSKYKAIQTKTTEYGISYDVKMVLVGKTGRRLEVVTAWQIDNGNDVPRFITITFPKKKKV